MSYLKEILQGGLSLIEGMAVTFRRLFQPLVTVQYPRQRMELSPAYRGHIELKIFEDSGTHKCIACLSCERICPSGVIRVKGEKTQPKGPKVPVSYIINFSRCSLCGLCVESCPTRTIQFSREYELVGTSGSDCLLDLLDRCRKQVEARKRNEQIAA